jgi:aspartyl-tRNA(Asn)/glutamyl-tRNA(Gln) amidotransferase subunit B
MRSKEDSHDYRYFPEPDLPPLRVDAAWLASIRAALPELPAARRARYEADLGLSSYDAAVIVGDARATELFERARAAAPDAEPKMLANWVTGAFLGLLRTDPEAAARVDPGQLADLVGRVTAGDLSGTNAKEVFAAHAADGATIASIIDARGLRQISDIGALAPIVEEVVTANPKAVEDFRAGKPVLGFFVGQVMKATAGKANPAMLNERLKAKLSG